MLCVGGVQLAFLRWLDGCTHALKKPPTLEGLEGDAELSDSWLF